MDLHHLAYISKSQIDGTDQVIEWELESILAAAVRNNPLSGLTGALLYSGGYFCQILEGPRHEVKALFDRICTDQRHSDVNALIFEPIKERQFSNWAMAFAGWEPQQRFCVDGMRASKEDLDAQDLGRTLVDTLVQMVRERQGKNRVIAPRNSEGNR